MTLCIKTGMTTEQQIAKCYADPSVLVLTGQFTVAELDAALPKTIDAILSFGVCGGLAPQAQIGQAFIYDAARTPNGNFIADIGWRKRLFAATKYYERTIWSSGEFNTANTVEERAQLFQQSGCWIIDDETYAVAQVAKQRNIPWAGLRTVSDGAEDTLPPAIVNALNPNGSTNLLAVIESLETDPAQLPDLIKTALEAKRSFDELDTAAIAVGRAFQWQLPK